MTSNSKRVHSVLGSKVADKYRAQGFEVVLEPQNAELPFDLGTYRPDLIAKKSPNEGYIIEVKSSVSRIPIDRYREIAEVVAQHVGWRFLLVTGEDVSLSEQATDGDGLLTWEQMLQRQIQAERLLSLGEAEGAFLSLWGILEAALRRQANKMSIPIERFPTLSLINHLYSQGELSIEQFDKVKALQAIRNRFVHGYQTPNLVESTKQLQELVNELIALWGQ
ncbi:hypothetical protein THII_1622 [Thioploca ingrica]|uniref:REase AHJR-like domain-containing protein n=1 Tax=Thioploca ingrica TaxID=40754 RepID=A0A090AFS0_9GAMM|nr:hypothetical protein THII_1622 [Thioploca ingrica]